MEKYLDNYGMVTFLFDLQGKPRWSGTYMLFPPTDITGDAQLLGWVKSKGLYQTDFEKYAFEKFLKNREEGIEAQYLKSPCILGVEEPTECMVSCNLSGSVFKTNKSKLKNI